LKKHIAFIGDSYCASYSENRPNLNWHQSTRSADSYTELVAQHFGYDIAAFGFSAKSWWYSWSLFDKQWAQNLDQIEALVFCHTIDRRINSRTHDDLPCTPIVSQPCAPELKAASEYYFKYISDPEFNSWAQQQYFKMLNEKFSTVKTIHFHCYPPSVAYSDLLPGVVFTTPLSWISLGELVGTREETDRQFGHCRRANHMNAHNNKQMAQIIIDVLEQPWQPGQRELSMTAFDHPNPNAINWYEPKGIYWTRP
jgi:hypothetical protein